MASPLKGKYVVFDWIVGRDGTRHGRVGAFDGRDGTRHGRDGAFDGRDGVATWSRAVSAMSPCPSLICRDALRRAIPAVSKRVLVQYIVGDDRSDPGSGAD